MADKEKQIEEMAKDIEHCCNRYDEEDRFVGNKCSGCEYWCDTNNLCCSFGNKEATYLYNAGYRKIPEGSVVVSKEEHKQLYNDERASYYRAENLAIENDLLNRKLIDARKETAREILQIIEDDRIGYWDSCDCGKDETYWRDNAIQGTLNEIAKQFGVEVEE